MIEHPNPAAPGGVAVPATPVLVAEDDPLVRAMLRLLLEGEGLPVETAEDGPSAVRRATGSRPSLVVLDLGLRGLDGEGVVAALRRLYGDGPPIVVNTAGARPAEAARRIGALACLDKPFDLEALLAAVWRGLGSDPVVQ